MIAVTRATLRLMLDRPVREVLLVWAGSIALIAILLWGVAPLHPLLFANRGGLAALVFLIVPGEVLKRRGEYLIDYGVRFDRWRRDLLLALVVCAVIFPLFFLVYWGFVIALPKLPFAAWLAPYTGGAALNWRLPDRFLELILAHLFAAALPEEVFYRGYMQGRLEQAWPATARLAGVPFGKAALVTAALFALGHLVEPAPWRLGTFFPGLLFGWLRARSGTILPGVIVHASSNVFMKILEASFFGAR